jgi:hypothetical protein
MGKQAVNFDELVPLVDLCRAGKLFEVQAWIAESKPVNPPSGHYVPPTSPGGEGGGSPSEDPGPRPPWWPEDWPWPPPPDEPVVIEAPPPLPNIIWPRLPPDHPYHLPPGYHYPDNLPEGHPGHYYPGMPPYPVIAP